MKKCIRSLGFWILLIISTQSHLSAMNSDFDNNVHEGGELIWTDTPINGLIAAINRINNGVTIINQVEENQIEVPNALVDACGISCSSVPTDANSFFISVYNNPLKSGNPQAIRIVVFLFKKATNKLELVAALKTIPNQEIIIKTSVCMGRIMFCETASGKKYLEYLDIPEN